MFSVDSRIDALEKEVENYRAILKKMNIDEELVGQIELQNKKSDDEVRVAVGTKMATITCLGIAFITIVLHMLLYHAQILDIGSLWGNDGIKSQYSSISRELGTHHSNSHHAKKENSAFESHIDLSQMKPLTKLNPNSPPGLYVFMPWNIGNEGGELDIPPYKEGVRYKLMVDVGLEYGSGLMCLLQHDPSLVLLGFEAHPINFGVAFNAMRRNNIKTTSIRPRMNLLPLALSSKDEFLEFKENYVPACGSILESAKGGWWCSHTAVRRPVPAVRLDSILSLVPSNYDFHFLKIDVEGAERVVLEGGGDFIAKFEMISFEVEEDQKGSRVGEASLGEMEKLLTPMGFTHHFCARRGSYDCHFAKSNSSLFEAARLQFTAARFGPFPHPSKYCDKMYHTNYELFDMHSSDLGFSGTTVEKH